MRSWEGPDGRLPSGAVLRGQSDGNVSIFSYGLLGLEILVLTLVAKSEAKVGSIAFLWAARFNEAAEAAEVAAAFLDLSLAIWVVFRSAK